VKHALSGLAQIWKEAFNEDDLYIDFFINNGLPLGHLLTLGPSETPYCALTLFPIDFKQAGVIYSGYYLYALGTLLSQRGRGYGSMLIKKAEEYAIETNRQFILLQPTNYDLFRYYYHLGYVTPVYRASITCTKASLCSLLLDGMNLQHLLSKISVSCETNLTTKSNQHFDRFIWSPTLLQYIQKECLFRGGAVLSNSYCYFNKDNNGSYLEIKEFQASFNQIPMLIEAIISTFPHIDRFCFFGNTQHIVENEINQEAFALLHFFNTTLQKCFNVKSYFSLGLD